MAVRFVSRADSHSVWQTEARAKKRKFASEYVSPSGGTWMYSADTFVDNVLQWIKNGASLECRSCGSLVHTSLTEHIVSENIFPTTCDSCATCSAGIYHIPQPADVPDVLQGNLTELPWLLRAQWKSIAERLYEVIGMDADVPRNLSC